MMYRSSGDVSRLGRVPRLVLDPSSEPELIPKLERNCAACAIQALPNYCGYAPCRG
jgi:hypothetical protein